MRALASSPAFAVTRTLMPSMPLARKAIVGFDCESTRAAIISASVDSATPHVRNTRLKITACSPDRARRSGMTARSTISCISWGTPGTA